MERILGEKLHIVKPNWAQISAVVFFINSTLHIFTISHIMQVELTSSNLIRVCVCQAHSLGAMIFVNLYQLRDNVFMIPNNRKTHYKKCLQCSQRHIHIHAHGPKLRTTKFNSETVIYGTNEKKQCHCRSAVACWSYSFTTTRFAHNIDKHITHTHIDPNHARAGDVLPTNAAKRLERRSCSSDTGGNVAFSIMARMHGLRMGACAILCWHISIRHPRRWWSMCGIHRRNRFVRRLLIPNHVLSRFNDNVGLWNSGKW